MICYTGRQWNSDAGACWKHPRRDRTTLEVAGMGTIRIPLGDNKFALIEEEDYPLVSQYPWHAYRTKWNVYAGTTVRLAGGENRTLLLHRLLLGAKPGEEVDHIDLDGLNCTRKNLRLASHLQNVWNQRRKITNTSGYKGVYLVRGRNVWHARIRDHGRQIHLGYFVDPVEAARAYDAKAREIAGEFARLNFPEEGEARA
jgi:hypothetical protein